MRYFVYELAIMRNVCKSEHTYYYCLMCVYARLGLTLTFLRSSIRMNASRLSRGRTGRIIYSCIREARSCISLSQKMRFGCVPTSLRNSRDSFLSTKERRTDTQGIRQFRKAILNIRQGIFGTTSVARITGFASSTTSCLRKSPKKKILQGESGKSVHRFSHVSISGIA